MTMRTRLAVQALMALGLVLGAKAAEPAATNGQTVILDEGSYWRYFLTARKPVYRKGGEVIVMKYGGDTALPPANWKAADFDDLLWERLQGPFFPTGHGWAWTPAVDNKGFIGYDGTSPYMALLCARGKFMVTDLKSARDLTLSLVYRGGAVVYLNGKEVARGHLPDAEKEGPNAMAEPYPDEAFVNPQGNCIGNYTDAEKNIDRLQKRLRRIADIKIPASLLRQGVNVLAVEVHRAPYSEAILKYQGAHGTQQWDWLPMGLVSLELKGDGQGIVADRGRPKGLQVWARNPARWPNMKEFGSITETAQPVRIFGARNGVFSAEIMVGSSADIEDLKVESGVFEGPGHIPASALRIRYVQNMGEGSFDALNPVAPTQTVAVTKGATGVDQPVYLTVRVPKDAKAGVYKNKVTAKVAGATPLELPVELSVADWTLPDSKTFQTQAGLLESPESVALQYKVDFWSEAHWKLLDQVFGYMGELGADNVAIQLERQTHFGNSQSMVRWIPKEGGGFRYDFGIAERYLDLAIRHLGKPPVVTLVCWDQFNGFRAGNSVHPAWTNYLYSTYDPKTGKVGEGDGPRFGTPEFRSFLKPVTDGMKEMIQNRGLGGSLLVGIIGDNYPVQEVYDDLAALLPGVRWMYTAHKPTGWDHVGYFAYVYVGGIPPDPLVDGRLYGWKAAKRMSVSRREQLAQDTHPVRYRTALESCLVAGYMGLERVGIDFWPVMGRYGALGAGTLGRRYPNADWMQLNIGVSASALLAPGRDGPLTTVRFELMRASIQECEARILIEKVLADPARKAKLGDALAGECQDVLDARQRELFHSSQSLWFLGGWENRAGDLYRLAGEVAGR